MDNVGSIVEPTSSLAWADVIQADFQWVMSRYIQKLPLFIPVKVKKGHQCPQCGIEEVPYCFSRSSIKFQGYRGIRIYDLFPILSKMTRSVAAIKSLRFALYYFLWFSWLLKILLPGWKHWCILIRYYSPISLAANRHGVINCSDAMCIPANVISLTYQQMSVFVMHFNESYRKHSYTQ